MNDQDEDDQEGDSRSPDLTLTTVRLVLRAPVEQDAGAIATLANNRRVAEQTRRMPYPYSRDDAFEWIDMAREASEPVFLVTRKCDGEVLGGAGCAEIADGELEVGYWLGEPHWGQGYATEAIQAVIDHVFGALSIERIYGHCRVVNGASRKVMVKCGFQHIGSGMCDSRANKGLVPVEEFALERSVWESLKRWGKAS